jgi:NADPH:quinone reductase-like Zn-dependent oxidoreductase
MARIVRFHAFGGPGALRLDELEVGEPGPGEARIRVGAFGLNRVEAYFRAGEFMPPGQLPSTIGYEAAGVIEAVGPGVSEWCPGDRIATLFGLEMDRYGTNGEVILYPADMLVAVPPGQSLTQAAASWMQYGTAYGLVDVGQIAAGDTVVINAASSSVGLAAIQIARAEDALPIAITRTRDKADALLAQGAAHVIVSDEEDVPARIMEITGGAGARLAFDAVAGAPLADLLSAMAPRGTVIVYGMLGGFSFELMLPVLMLGNLALHGFSADRLIRDPADRARMIGYVSRELASGALSPVIDSTFDISQVAEAHGRLESNRQLGKIVVATQSAGE